MMNTSQQARNTTSSKAPLIFSNHNPTTTATTNVHQNAPSHQQQRVYSPASLVTHSNTNPHAAAQQQQYNPSPTNSTNTTKSDKNGKNSQKRKREAVSKACWHCRKAHAKCSDERPCKRCVKRKIECVEESPDDTGSEKSRSKKMRTSSSSSSGTAAGSRNTIPQHEVPSNNNGYPLPPGVLNGSIGVTTGFTGPTQQYPLNAQEYYRATSAAAMHSSHPGVAPHSSNGAQQLPSIPSSNYQSPSRHQHYQMHQSTHSHQSPYSSSSATTSPSFGNQQQQQQQQQHHHHQNGIPSTTMHQQLSASATNPPSILQGEDITYQLTQTIKQQSRLIQQLIDQRNQALYPPRGNPASAVKENPFVESFGTTDQPAAMWQSHPDRFTVLFANQAFCDMLGSDLSDLQGTTLSLKDIPKIAAGTYGRKVRDKPVTEAQKRIENQTAALLNRLDQKSEPHRSMKRQISERIYFSKRKIVFNMDIYVSTLHRVNGVSYVNYVKCDTFDDELYVNDRHFPKTMETSDITNVDEEVFVASLKKVSIAACGGDVGCGNDSGACGGDDVAQTSSVKVEDGKNSVQQKGELRTLLNGTGPPSSSSSAAGAQGTPLGTPKRSGNQHRYSSGTSGAGGGGASFSSIHTSASTNQQQSFARLTSPATPSAAAHTPSDDLSFSLDDNLPFDDIDFFLV